MALSPISSNILNLLSPSSVKLPASDETTGSFADIFTEALNTASATDTLDKTSALELLSGSSDSFSGLLLDAQKAEISLNLALQLRNKLLDAYSEIMRISL